MARQKISKVERHVEKGVAVLFAVVLGWGLWEFGLNSPNTIDMAGDQVGPSQIDDKVMEKAKRVYGRIAAHKPEPFEIENLPKEQAALAVGPLAKKDAVVSAILRAPVPFGPSVPAVQGPGDTGQVTLATLNAPSALAVTSGRLLAYMPPGDAAVVGEDVSDRQHELMIHDGFKDVPWVSIGIEFNARKQRGTFIKHNYDTRKMDVQVTDIKVQRRRALGGTWGSWETVKPYKVHVFEPWPQLVVEQGDTGPVVPIEQRKALLTALEEVSDFEQQVLRPKMPQAYDGDEWVPPFCAQLNQVYYGENWDCPAITQQVPERRLNPRKQAEFDIEQARQLLDQGLLDEAMILVQDVVDNQKLPKKVRENANLVLEKIEDAIDIRTRQEIENMEQDEVVDEFGETEAAPLDKQYFVATDISALPGDTYEYRVKLLAFNQYAGQLASLQEPGDAEKIEIDGTWSEPTTPVVVPAMQRIYMVAADDADREVRFEVFKWFEGAWLKHVHRARIGQTIGDEEKVQHPLTGEKVTVDFDTGLTLVDMISDRVFVPVKESRKGGATVGEPALSPACLVVGRERIFENVQERDKIDPDRKEIQSQIDAFKKKARKKKRRP